MIIYSYIIEENSYKILKNGKPFVIQVGLPISGSYMNNITSEQIAKLLVGKLNNRLMPIVTESEEKELSTNVVTDERIKELINVY
jgi:hypothetical protein